MESDESTLSIITSERVPAATDGTAFPALIEDAGQAARFAFEEFFYGRIRNPHTRKSYSFAVRQFLEHCKRRGIELVQITPADVGRYLDNLSYSPGTKKVHLAALRNFFDELVRRHVMILNPAHSVRSERLEVVEGKTPEIPVTQARQLLRSIDTTHVVGLRDRAIIGILIYTAARVGAIAKLSRRNFYDSGDQYCLRFTEKRGKSRELPVRHDLRGYVLEYIAAGRLEFSEPTSPMFRTTIRRTRYLTQNGMTAGDIGRMLKRRLRGADLPSRFSPHSFRVCTITDLLHQGVPLADVQLLAGHNDPRTTRLYDRRHRQVTRNVVERISV